MSKKRKEIISEKTVVIWLLSCVLISIICSMFDTIVIYFIYDCWMFRQVGTDSCSGKIPQFIFFIPSVIGLVVGTILTRKIVKGVEKK